MVDYEFGATCSINFCTFAPATSSLSTDAGLLSGLLLFIRLFGESLSSFSSPFYILFLARSRQTRAALPFRQACRRQDS